MLLISQDIFGSGKGHVGLDDNAWRAWRAWRLEYQRRDISGGFYDEILEQDGKIRSNVLSKSKIFAIK